MIRSILICILFMLLQTNIISAQNSLAKIEYSYAEEAYSNNDYKKALEHLEEVKSLLGSTNARVMYLEILSRNNNLPNYQAFNNSFTANNSNSISKNQATPALLSAANSLKELYITTWTNDIKIYKKHQNIIQYKEMASLYTYLVSKLQSGQNITFDDFLPSTYNNILNKENPNSEINNWLESVELINALSDIYIENFESEVPLEKLKKIYEIKKQCKVFIPNKKLIIKSWETLKNEDNENALAKFKELQMAGIESSTVITELERIIQLEQFDDKTISNIENNMVFVKGDAATKVPDLYVSKYELTVKVYTNIAFSRDSKMRSSDEWPVNLKKEDAKIFIEKLNQKSKKKYRLPTKEEWFWFATGGSKTSDEKRGINKDKSDRIYEYAWLSENSRGDIKAVGSLKPNELGLHDVWGCSSELTTTIAVGGSARTKKKKMVKGDSYVNSFMWNNEDDDDGFNIGIRLVRTSNN